jgi:hypothetical protein
MRKLIFLPLLFASTILPNQLNGNQDSTQTMPKETQVTQPKQTENKWYYGGTLGFNFWNDYFYLTVQPMVGYKVSPKFSVGGKIGYSYINYDEPDYDTHNYGASLFARFRPIPQFYLHSEFVYWSYETAVYNPSTQNLESGREWVPFILLGGGFVQQLGPNTSAFVEVLVDVLQDDNSPYEDWDPFVSFGVGVGF